jgi:hypothetical protein
MNKVKEQFKLSIMKKIFTLLALVGVLSLQSCTVTDDVYVEDTPVSQVLKFQPRLLHQIITVNK